MQSGAADPGRFVLAGPRVGKSSEYDSWRSPPGRYVQSGAGLLWCGGDKNARVRTEMVNVDVKKKTLIRTQQRQSFGRKQSFGDRSKPCEGVD